SEVKIYIKPLSDGSFGIGFFNMSDAAGEGSLQFWDMGLSSANGLGFKFRDLWEHEDLGVFTEHYTCKLEPHTCKVFRAVLVQN
ncbi:MAG: hypothetical protein WBI07_04655, partial [Mobilitalea sp.]